MTDSSASLPPRCQLSTNPATTSRPIAGESNQLVLHRMGGDRIVSSLIARYATAG